MRLTRPALVLALLGVAIASSTLLTSTAAPPPASRPPSRAAASLPVTFEPAADGSFASYGPGYSLALSATDAVIGVDAGAFRLRPAGPGASAAAELVPAQPLQATVTRLTGDGPSRTVGTYGRVEARQVWPGVDMVWHGDQRRLEHDMVIAPAVDPGVVAFDVDGATSLAVDGDGALVVGLTGGEARLDRPAVYQDLDGRRVPVAGDFAVLGPSRFGFTVGPYDPDRPLVIDPTLVTSTLVGGNGLDAGYAIAVDAQGNTYVTGSTESTDLPLVSPLQGALANAAAGTTSDVFVSKLSPDGSRLMWSTYLGGGGRDIGYALAVGADGSVYVSGVTESNDFPRARAAQENYGGGPSDAFVAKIAPTGAALDWSTYIGGTQTDRARGVAVDSQGNAYVVGSTNSAEFPAVNPLQPGPYRPDDVDGFLVKVPAGGGPLAFSTRLGGSNDDRALAVAVDGQGSAYVTGDTLSPGFPTMKPIQPASGGSQAGVAGSFPDAFVTKFSPAGSSLVYSTFLGGSDVDQGTAIAVDTQGAAYVAGNTNSPNFPTVSPFQPRKDNDADAFVTKIDGAGAALVYSTYVGGSAADGANAIAVDRAGNAVVVGTTGSANFPANHPLQSPKGGAEDAFLLRLEAAGRPTFSTFIGGRDADAGTGVAFDSQGRIHLLGLTGSADFPSVKPVQNAHPPAAGDAFVATVDLADAAPSAATPSATPAASSSSSAAHDRRVRLLAGLTFALLLAAVLQTMYLKRRPAPAGAGPGRRATPPPARTPARARATAEPGVKVLGDGPTKPVKVGASKSVRTPKARGGPKGGPKPAKDTPPVAVPDTTEVALPPVPAPAPSGDAEPATPPPRPKRHEPAIAQLLEEDLWAPEPSTDAPDDAPPVEDTAASLEPAPAPAPPEPAAPEPAAPAAPEPAAPPPPAAAGPEPARAIPPVPAAELSFWDLFPEDLPPARPANAPVEDVLVDRLALPEGPDSNAGRLLAPLPEEFDVPATDEPPPSPPSPPPPEAEIVIAELLDGPPPTGARTMPPPPSPWAPPPDEDFAYTDLLAGAPDDAADDGEDGEDGEDADEPAPVGRTKEEMARIAADRARRRRNRRSGRRKPGGGNA